MLSFRLFPSHKNISYFKQSSRQLHSSSKLLITNDSSNSESSESDSDKENTVTKKDVNRKIEHTIETLNKPDANERLKFLLENISKRQNRQQESISRVSSVSAKHVIKEKKIFKPSKKPIQEKELSFDKKLEKAAKDVAAVYKGDSEKVQLDLLSKVLNTGHSSESKKDECSTSPSNLSDLLSDMKIENVKAASFYDNKPYARKSKLLHYARQRSIAPESDKKLINSQIELNTPYPKMGIFNKLVEKDIETSPKLLVWEAMEEREIKLLKWNPPENFFEELIQWTNEGKLWHFPINNEQGMEEQEKVHFSEHIFMERHLKSWCPRKGPIRHFMELVCTGLSKNPYMTVQEKIEHIAWYKNYFENKKDLLTTLNLLDNHSAIEKQELKV